MDSAERRKAILKLLEESEEPVSAGSMAKRFFVSWQSIVGDVDFLRASSHAISATARGYILEKEKENGANLYTVACRHARESIGDELYAVVDQGGGVLDVIVEHPVYGQIAGKLRVFSRYDADQFLKKLKGEEASPLSALTGGVHLHTLYCPSEEIFQRICGVLREKGFLFEPNEE